jgi:hypothetical protein
VLGIVGFFMTCGLTAPVGIVIGVLGLNECKHGTKGGRGLAIAGLITSIVATLVWLGIILFYVALIFWMPVDEF